MTAKITKASHSKIVASLLEPHPKVQRKFQQNWAQQIHDQFDIDKLGELAVVKNGDGKYYVFDGQHRLWATKKKMGDTQIIPCLVYHDMPLSRQAELFLGRNNAKGVKIYDKYQQGILAGRASEMDIDAIVKELGLKVGINKHPRTIMAVGALMQAYSKYGRTNLKATLSILNQAWGTDKDAFDNVLIRGMSMFLKRYWHDKSKMDPESLVHKLQRLAGPAGMIGKIKDRARMDGTTLQKAGAEEILRAYNRGMKVPMK